LWLCAIYLSDVGAAVPGLIWVAGRVLYFVGYRSAVKKRLPGFFVQSSACMLLLIGAIAGLVIHH
jgi:glutathione S-transferase